MPNDNNVEISFKSYTNFKQCLPPSPHLPSQEIKPLVDQLVDGGCLCDTKDTQRFLEEAVNFEVLIPPEDIPISPASAEEFLDQLNAPIPAPGPVLYPFGQIPALPPALPTEPAAEDAEEEATERGLDASGLAPGPALDFTEPPAPDLQLATDDFFPG